MKKILITILAAFLVNFAAWGQTISGGVFAEDGLPVAFANVVLMAADSSYVDGTITDADGKFTIKKNVDATFLTVSCLGYEKQTLNVNADVSRIVLKKSDLLLDEINIIAERKKIQIKNDAMVTNIGGTPIAKLSDIQHVLNVIPGVVSQNETLTVLGKGAPLVYINNRKIRDLSEVYQLSPDNIKNIELITNPGAKYDSEVKAVLKINTIAPTGEGFSVDNKLTGGYQYKCYFADNLKLNYRHKNLDVFASAGYSCKKYKENVLSTDETFISSYYNMLTDDDNYNRHKPFSSKVGMNYDFKSGKSIGFAYSNRLTNSDIESCTATELRQDGTLCDNLITANIGDSKSGFHLVNAYNSGSLLSWNYEIDYDAMFNYSDYDYKIAEAVKATDTYFSASLANEPIVLDCNEKNGALLNAFKTEICKDILSGEISIGTEHSFVNRKGVCKYLQYVANNSNCRVKETNSAIYSELSQEFDNWGFTLGLRYEFVRSNYFEYEVKQNEYCRKYHNLFPSVSFDFSLGGADLSLSYDRSVQRPYYDQLGNQFGFINRYAYETGNPRLKPSYFDDFCVNIVYKDLSFMADFFVNYDYIYDAYTTYGDDCKASLIKPENYDKFHQVQTTVSYTPTFGFYRPNLSASVFWQDMSIVFCGVKKVFDKPYGAFRFGNLFELPWQTTASAVLRYTTAGDDELGWIDDNFTCNCEISKIFGNWTVAFVCDDVFKTANQHFNMYGNIRKCTIKKHSDTRKIELSIRYKLNAAKSKYKGTGAGNEEKDRI